MSDAETKAAALYHVIAFSDWPSTAFASPNSPLLVGVLGEGPVGALLVDVTRGETWRGRSITVRRCATPAEARSCHVVYIATSEQGRWRTLNRQFVQLPILTASDAVDFAREGGIVQMSVDRNRLRLAVNLAAARAGGLVLSSKLLRLAEVIDHRVP